MKRLHLLTLAALVLSGCALLQKAASGDVRGVVHEGGSAALEAKQIADAANSEAASKCGGLDTQSVSLEEEKAIGGAIAVGFTQSWKASLFIDGNAEKDPEALRLKVEAKQPVALPDSEKNNLAAYLSVVGRNLASYSSRPDIGWTFGVIDSPTVNAVATPGGYVYVTTGLLKLVDNEAQLAGVLAHEIGHITGRHTLKTYSKVKFQQCETATRGGVYVARGAQKLMPPELARGADMARYFSGGKLDLNGKEMAGKLVAMLTDGFTDDFISKGLGPVDEFDADKTAVELMVFAGYDTTEYDKLLQKLPANADSHHPAMSERLPKIKATRDGLADFTGKTAKPDNSAQLKVVKK